MNTKTYAKTIDRVIDGAENYTKNSRPFRPVYNPTAVLAAKDDLAVISKAIREDKANSKVLSGVHKLLTDGTESPLFGSDEKAARKAVAEVRAELAA
jgi:hypothetical protein